MRSGEELEDVEEKKSKVTSAVEAEPKSQEEQVAREQHAESRERRLADSF